MWIHVMLDSMWIHVMLGSTQNHDKVTRAWNLHVGHRHQVIVCAWIVCRGQLICKVWYSHYHHFREIHFNARLDVNIARLDIKSWQSHSSMKSRSRAPVHSACLKSMLRTIITQGLTLLPITGWPHIFSNQIPWFFPDLIWFSLIKNLNIIAMAPTFRSHILIQMLSSDMFTHNAVTIFLIKWKFI